uniref:Ig-like domain-containing protein n=1 Tax=Poecilia latipinna TaxID=48699 RepID=A0A3B3W2Q9_9TELE
MLSLLSENNLILVVLHLYHFFLPSAVNCQQLTAGKTEEFSSEGSSATLTCSYTNKISASDDFFWYRQNPGKPPDSRSAESLKSSTRFSTYLRGEKHLDLLISSAAVTDSAVYYCARASLPVNPLVVESLD